MSYQNYNQAGRGRFGGQNRNPGTDRVYAQMQWESPEQEASAETDSEAVTAVDGMEETKQQDNSSNRQEASNGRQEDWETNLEWQEQLNAQNEKRSAQVKTGNQGQMDNQGQMGNQGWMGNQGQTGNQGQMSDQGWMSNQWQMGNQDQMGNQGWMGNQWQTENQWQPGNQGQMGNQWQPGNQGQMGKQWQSGNQGWMGNQSQMGNPGPMDWESQMGSQGQMNWQNQMGARGQMNDLGQNQNRNQNLPQSGTMSEGGMIPDMSDIAGGQWQEQMPAAMNQNGTLPTALNEEQQRDLEYFESMYPIRVKQIKIYVNAACDGLEYKGSPMYDEYPDRVVIDQLVDRILEKMTADGLGDVPSAGAEAAEEEETYEATVFPPYGWGGRPPYPDNRNNWMRDLAAVLLFNEFFRRRCRNCGPRRFY